MAQVRGLDELRRELNRADKRLRREVGKSHRQIGNRVVKLSRDRMQRVARGRGGYLGAKGIRASSSATRGRIVLSGANPRTIGDEFGARAWRQFLPWKGNQFTGLDKGTSGYAVQPVIRENREWILREMLNGYYDSLSRAYPHGR